MEKCNLCGRELDCWDKQMGFIFDRHIGYGSRFDGSNLHISICCGCFDKIIENCAINPIKEGD